MLKQDPEQRVYQECLSQIDWSQDQTLHFTSEREIGIVYYNSH